MSYYLINRSIVVALIPRNNLKKQKKRVTGNRGPLIALPKKLTESTEIKTLVSLPPDYLTTGKKKTKANYTFLGHVKVKNLAKKKNSHAVKFFFAPAGELVINTLTTEEQDRLKAHYEKTTGIPKSEIDLIVLSKTVEIIDLKSIQRSLKDRKQFPKGVEEGDGVLLTLRLPKDEKERLEEIAYRFFPEFHFGSNLQNCIIEDEKVFEDRCIKHCWEDEYGDDRHKQEFVDAGFTMPDANAKGGRTINWPQMLKIVKKFVQDSKSKVNQLVLVTQTPEFIGYSFYCVIPEFNGTEGNINKKGYLQISLQRRRLSFDRILATWFDTAKTVNTAMDAYARKGRGPFPLRLSLLEEIQVKKALICSGLVKGEKGFKRVRKSFQAFSVLKAEIEKLELYSDYRFELGNAYPIEEDKVRSRNIMSKSEFVYEIPSALQALQDLAKNDDLNAGLNININ